MLPSSGTLMLHMATSKAHHNAPQFWYLNGSCGNSQGLQVSIHITIFVGIPGPLYGRTLLHFIWGSEGHIIMFLPRHLSKLYRTQYLCQMQKKSPISNNISKLWKKIPVLDGFLIFLAIFKFLQNSDVISDVICHCNSKVATSRNRHPYITP